MKVSLQLALLFGDTLNGVTHAGVVMKDRVGGWIAAGIATPLGEGTLEEVFDNHAHKVLAEGVWLGRAVYEAWKFARTGAELEACACEEYDASVPYRSGAHDVAAFKAPPRYDTSQPYRSASLVFPEGDPALRGPPSLDHGIHRRGRSDEELRKIVRSFPYNGADEIHRVEEDIDPNNDLNPWAEGR